MEWKMDAVRATNAPDKIVRWLGHVEDREALVQGRWGRVFWERNWSREMWSVIAILKEKSCLFHIIYTPEEI